MKEDSNLVYIAKLQGTAFEMGYAYGQLFSEEIKSQLTNVDNMYPATAYGLLENYGVPYSVLRVLNQDILLRIA